MLPITPVPVTPVPGSSRVTASECSLTELEEHIAALGLPRYRARQLWHALYRRRASAIADVHEWPQTLREKASERLALTSTTILRRDYDAQAGTDKLVVRLHDDALVEVVVMRYPPIIRPEDSAPPRATLCISSQAGCPLGCAFCATGLMGWARDLTAGEIVEQVLHGARILAEEGRSVTNIVFMGMGEPFLVYDAVRTAIARMTDAAAFGLGARHITISTSGVVPGIERLTAEGLQVNLAISLHAPDDTTRSRIMPLNRRYPVADVMRATRAYIARTHRRVTFEYTLIHGVNDTSNHAHQLAALLRGLLAHVNLIPLNPVSGIDMVPTPPGEMAAFRDILTSAGVAATIRDTRGRAIQAACGQLQTETRRQHILQIQPHSPSQESAP